MILSEGQLRRIIRRALLSERAAVATASDIAKFTPKLNEWIEVLLDEMAHDMPKLQELNEKAFQRYVESLSKIIRVELVGLTSSMKPSEQRQVEKDKEAKGHRDWDKRRKSRGSGVKYWGSP